MFYGKQPPGTESRRGGMEQNGNCVQTVCLNKCMFKCVYILLFCIKWNNLGRKFWMVGRMLSL